MKYLLDPIKQYNAKSLPKTKAFSLENQKKQSPSCVLYNSCSENFISIPFLLNLSHFSTYNH